MPPWRSEVESKMASSIFDEKLAESVRKYTVLYDKRCADKLKETLARRDVANWDQCLMTENINLQYKCIFSVVLKRYFFHPLSTLYTKATTKKLNVAKAFHSCWPSWKKFDCAWLHPCILRYCICVRRFNVVSFFIYICVCIVWFQKISITPPPPHGWSMEIPSGWGG